MLEIPECKVVTFMSMFSAGSAPPFCTKLTENPWNIKGAQEKRLLGKSLVELSGASTTMP